MSKKAKKSKTERKPRKGQLGEIFGFSVTSVLRRLGLEGVSSRHARAIMKAQGVKIGDHSADVQVGLGKSKAKPAAPLTAAQVKELVSSASEPEKNGATPKAKKAKKSKPTKSAQEPAVV